MLIGICHHESDGCTRGFSFKDATQEPHFISLLAIGGDATLPRSPSVKFVLHELHIDVNARRHAINYPTDRLPMAFTKGCQRENMAKCIAHYRVLGSIYERNVENFGGVVPNLMAAATSTFI